LLGELGCLGLCLPERRHERDQRIAHGLLHRVFGGAVERHVVDDGADDDAAPHQCLDGVNHILVIAAEAVDPADYARVTSTELVQQAPAALTLGEASADAGYPFVLDDVVVIDFESGSPGLVTLMSSGLI